MQVTASAPYAEARGTIYNGKFQTNIQKMYNILVIHYINNISTDEYFSNYGFIV
jgi:hypothetical protein